ATAQLTSGPGPREEQTDSGSVQAYHLYAIDRQRQLDALRIGLGRREIVVVHRGRPPNLEAGADAEAHPLCRFIGPVQEGDDPTAIRLEYGRADERCVHLDRQSDAAVTDGEGNPTVEDDVEGVARDRPAL